MFKFCSVSDPCGALGAPCKVVVPPFGLLKALSHPPCSVNDLSAFRLKFPSCDSPAIFLRELQVAKWFWRAKRNGSERYPIKSLDATS